MHDAGVPSGVRVRCGTGVRAPVAELARAALDGVAALALEQVIECIAVGVCLAVEGEVHTVSATSDTPRVLDQIQYREEDGPCLAALQAGEPVRCEDYGHERRWPAVAQAARAAGVASSLSLPLCPYGEPVGALNLYSRSSGSFDTRSRRTAQSLARHGGAILATLDRARRPPAVESEEPAEMAHALAQLLAVAEGASREIRAALRRGAPPGVPEPEGTAIAERCVVLVQDALIVGAIELATVLGVPEDRLPR